MRLLNDRLAVSEYLASKVYSIADIATFPWIARHNWHDIGLNNYKNLKRWYVNISQRKNVLKGYKVMNENNAPPKP